jgi:hypothetical protein
MTVPMLLEHDSTTYSETFARIIELSKGWRTSATRYERLGPLTEIWAELQTDHPTAALPMSMVAHLLADLQDDPSEELRWDLASLHALAPVWEQGTDGRLFDAACRSLPSIYLSLAHATYKCGDTNSAREYVRRARLIFPILPESRYTDQADASIASLERVLAGARAA